MKILITGATGFFGQEIALRLSEEGCDVIKTSRSPYPDTDLKYLDITLPDRCRKLFAENKDIDTVVHCAAIAHKKQGDLTEEYYRRVNADGVLNVLESAVAFSAKRFVFISSVAVYGEFDLPVPVTEEHPAMPLGPYATAKKKAEEYCLDRQGQIDIYILRMATMYSKEWVFNIRKRVAPPVAGSFCYLLFEPGERRYSLCSRRNGTEAVKRIIEGNLSPGIYNVADNYLYCQEDILKAVRRVDGKRPTLTVPEAVLRAGLAAVKLISSPTLYEAIYGQYWKFCRPNIFSTDKLLAAGFNSGSDLLAMAGG